MHKFAANYFHFISIFICLVGRLVHLVKFIVIVIAGFC